MIRHQKPQSNLTDVDRQTGIIMVVTLCFTHLFWESCNNHVDRTSNLAFHPAYTHGDTELTINATMTTSISTAQPKTTIRMMANSLTFIDSMKYSHKTTVISLKKKRKCALAVDVFFSSSSI